MLRNFAVRLFFTAIWLVLLGHGMQSQTSFSVQPNPTLGKDAVLDGVNTTTNYGNMGVVRAKKSVISHMPTILNRSVLQFDLSSIPTNAYVISAKLTLSGGLGSGVNDTYLSRVSASWSESTCTWSSLATSIYTGDQIALGSMSVSTLTVDVKAHVQLMVTTPSTNYGWMLQLQNESGLNGSLSFASSDTSVADIRPKIEVLYTLCPSPFTVSQTTACVGGTSILTAPTNTNIAYTWSGPGIVASAANTATVNTAGVYTVSAGACGTATRSVTFSPLPNVSAGTTQTVTCTIKTVTLTGSSTTKGATYTWTPVSSHNPTVAVVNPGVYTLTVTDPATGCTASSTVAVISNATPPNVGSGAPQVLTCTTHTVTLTGSSTTTGATFYWAPDGITTAIRTATAAGVYTITVTDPANGCKSSQTVAVTTNTTPPNVSAGSSQAITCAITTATLTGNSTTTGATYTWSPGGSHTATTIATSPGVYTLTVTDPANGCTAASTVAVVTNTTPPNVSAGSSQTLTCDVLTVTLTGTSTTTGATYLWSPGGITTAARTATAAGVYSLTVTNPSNGCTATATVAVITNTAPPNANPGAPQIITCASPTVTLSGSSTTTGAYGSWTGPQPGRPPLSFTWSVTVPGTYTLSVTDPSNGCSSTATITVTTNTTIPDVTVNSLQTISCSSATAAISGSSSVAGATYAWTGPTAGTPAGTNPTATTTTVSAAGVYTLTVTDPSNGCTATGTVSVISVSGSYAELRKKMDGECYLLSCNKLYFSLDGEYNQATLNYLVYKYDGVPVSGLTVSSSSLNYGDNRYFIDMTALASDYYTLEVTNQKNEKRFLRFKK